MIFSYQEEIMIHFKLTKATGISLLLSLAFLLTGCIVPNNAYLMELNRNGKWREVERIGQDILDKRKTFTHSEICETYFHVIYAKTRMQKTGEAIKLMQEYDGFSSREEIDPSLLWLSRETAKLKDELGLLSEAQRILLNAMEENGKNNFSLALDLAQKALKSEKISDAERATANILSAVCSLKLGNTSDAERYFAQYSEVKSALPKNHPAILEEKYVTQALSQGRN